LCGFSVARAQSRAVSFSFSYTTTADRTDYGPVLTDGEGGVPDVPGVTYQVLFTNAAEAADGTVMFYGYGNHPGPGEDPSLYLDGRRGYLYPSGADGGGSPAYQLVLQTADGSEFSFKSIYLVNFNGATASDFSVEVEGYRNGVSTGSITTHADNPQFGLNLTQSNGLTPAIFQNVDKVVLRPAGSSVYNSNFWYYVNDISFDNAVVSLPVRLTAFDAQVQANGTVRLNWTTASEEENSHFEVERSGDGRRFVPIAKLAGNGTQQTTSYYSYTDAAPGSGINYYRLKSTDLDGHYTYSYTLVVRNESTLAFEVFPNPAQDQVYIQLQHAPGPVTIRVVDAGGREVLQKQLSLSGGSLSTMIDIRKLQPGIYYILANNEKLKLVKE
jgi:hypothetical protein